MRSATGSTPTTPNGWLPTGPRRWAARRPTRTGTATRPRSCGCTAATVPTRRWTERAIACFDQALSDVGLDQDERALSQVLHDYFAWATTTTMARYHDSTADVPDGLGLPHWSWDGLV